MYFSWRDSSAIVVVLIRITSSFDHSQHWLTEAWNIKPATYTSASQHALVVVLGEGGRLRLVINHWPGFMPRESAQWHRRREWSTPAGRQWKFIAFPWENRKTHSHSCATLYGWLRGPVVEHWSLADVLSLSCARLVADGWPLMWVSYPL